MLEYRKIQQKGGVCVKKAVCITVDENVFIATKKFAEQNAMKVSTLITNLLRNYLRQHGIEV